MVGVNLTAVASADHIMGVTAFFKTTMAGQPSVTLFDAVGNSGKVSMENGDNITGTVSWDQDNGFRGEGTNGAAATDRNLRFQYTAVDEL